MEAHEGDNLTHWLISTQARVRDFFEKIWPAVVDVSHPDVRDAAASALAAALELVAARPAFNSGYYCAIYQKAHRAL